MASSIAVPRYLRFCPQCNAEDLKLYGELYWHRLHQVPGVSICPRHGVFLQDSSIPVQGFNRHQYSAASSDNCPIIERHYSYGERTRKQLQIIAADILWLLEQNLASRAPEYFQYQYCSLLIERGLANCNGRIHCDRLQVDFQSFYDREVLTLLDSTVAKTKDYNWLLAITRKHRKSFHPIRHLLMIRFLTDSVDRFFSTNYQYQPFGKGPWVCLNPTAPHYHQPVVTDLKISHCLENKQPLGVFSCCCGLVYSRTGPDRSDEDKYKIGKIIEFGELWQEKLQELVEQRKLGLRAVARALRVDTRTVQRYVSRLRLESHWEKRQATTSSESTAPKIFTRLPMAEEQRERWITLQQQYPQATKTGLRKLAPATYTWLYRNDRQWLDDHSPALQQPVATGERVDWAQRDLEVLDRRGDRVLTWRVMRLAGLGENINDRVGEFLEQEVNLIVI